jgi:putative transposase
MLELSGKARDVKARRDSMRKSRFSESQIVAILTEGAAGRPTAELLRTHGISAATYYAWTSKCGGLSASAR